MEAAQRPSTAVEPPHAIRVLGHSEHTHRLPHLIYVAIGVAHLRVNSRPMTLRAREAVWLAPGVPHAARYEPGSLVLGPLLSPNTVPRAGVHRLPPMTELSQLMTALLGIGSCTEDQIAMFRGRLDTLLNSVALPLFPLTPPRHPAAGALARSCVTTEQPLVQLAAAHGLSARQAQRIFVAETGLPFRRWRVQARLNIAAERLRGGSSVDAAAAVAGYATASGLRKALLREAGLDIDALRG
ncbi:helix-turn-helix domain-containing protein [Gordonia alkaliphila]|uniref:helix-turn-helix domain-containing protein n=1 Tax=Gordonia alkaliphila TaxID=1053547 RepID=UPI001FF442DE|nr:helix-turn-helix domain-containing protein [Gordonia alkaliphila]MCK0437924.1 helix-turn-helix domain-containing protein [Gordonia alkaliphila]